MAELKVAAAVTGAARPSLDLASASSANGTSAAAATSSDDLLDALSYAHAIEARTAAAKLSLVAALRNRRVADSVESHHILDERAFTAEIAARLHLSERAAQSLINTGMSLTTQLPATLAALAAGSISYQHARIMVEQIVGLGPECAAALEARMLPAAATSSPPRFATKVRKARERLHPETIDQRHESALADRTVSIEEDRDGMVLLINKTDAVTGLAIYDKLTSAAVSMKKRGDARTLAHLRSDILAVVMLASGHRIAGLVPDLDDTERFVNWFAGIKAEVIVSVPALSLLAESDEPATLEGYGPISLDVARWLASRAPGFVRVLTHPETGAVLSVGRKRYKIPKDLRMFLRVRDGTCRFPGCGRTAERCDIDHSKEWHELGETAHDNLAHVCPGHHNLKSAGKWKVAQATDGSGILTWTSPMGRKYVTHPETLIAAR